MPVIESAFRPPWLLSNGHMQTILGALLRRRPAAFQRERLELADGDFLDLDWQRTGHSRLAILSHGLEGCSTAGYITSIAAALDAAGWDVLAWNMRGCGGELNRLARGYHSGESGDLRTVISHAATTSYDTLSLIGFSLGGNVTLKYLGESPPHPKVASAACVSVPVDLRASADALDTRRENGLYLRRFLRTMVAKMQAKALRFPDQIARADLTQIRTLREFDGLFTAPLHGFKDAEDYWAKSSSRQFLGRIAVPTLLINARNDTFLTPHSMPFEEAEASKHFHFEGPASGGHVGFLTSLPAPPWHEQRVVEFLKG